MQTSIAHPAFTGCGSGKSIALLGVTSFRAASWRPSLCVLPPSVDEPVPYRRTAKLILPPGDSTPPLHANWVGGQPSLAWTERGVTSAPGECYLPAGQTPQRRRGFVEGIERPSARRAQSGIGGGDLPTE